MVNGSNNYTCISALGKSVVDYICVPHESLSLCKNFKVLTMSDLINKLQLYGQSKIPDHSLVSICLEFPFIDNICIETESGNTVKSVRYNLSEIPSSFLNGEESFELLNQTILNIENAISNQADADVAYENFVIQLQTEMENKLKKLSGKAKCTTKRNKSRAKPYWSDDLHDVCKAEKQWLSCKSAPTKKRLRGEYCLKRNNFNRALRKAKRKISA